jgi:hypothetical protein
MSYPVCPCDDYQIPPPVNLPQLSYISYRVGDYVSFRQAVLTPLFQPAIPTPLPIEQTLSVNGVPVWRTDGAGDLAVMIAEWFAYIADVVSFYNERIANQDYLRTADLPESVKNLIALLGYRPRPAIGAVGALAALLSPGPNFGGRAIVLPKGLHFQSKPTPGQTPQTFELSADTPIGAPDQLPASPAPALLGQVSAPVPWRFDPYRRLLGARVGVGASSSGIVTGESSLLLQGAAANIGDGDLLRLRALDGTPGGPWLATVASATIGPAPSGSGQQTNLTLTFSNAPPTSLTAATAALERANQSVGLWSSFANHSILAGADGGTTIVNLASLARQIQSGDWLLFTATGNSPPPVLAQVSSTQDVIWDANASSPVLPPFQTVTTIASNGSTTATNPLPIPHTMLTVSGLSGWETATGVTVQFGWVSVGVLLNQPFGVWTGTPASSLTLVGGQTFPAWSSQPILLQDATGLGVATTGSSPGNSRSLTIGTLPEPPLPLQPPFLVLPNLLPVTCGKTVTNEVLGSGDATNPAQDFQLSQSLVTYLSQGAGYASTIALTVNNMPWTEVASFYGQLPNATVFVTREDNNGKTHVMFGDGVNGARLPTGVNNVVATYRVGAGAASPPAGKLTLSAKSYPGLRSVLNPVAVSGGSDADQADQIQRDAPRSVLTFGRAVSVFDYEALAAEAPGVTRASAVWAWNDARQRTLVTVYVGDDSGAATSARQALAAAGDPNRPVVVMQATQIAVALIITLLMTPGMDPAIVSAGVIAALTDNKVGLFGSWNMSIGQTVFDSQIEAAVLSVQGAVAITAQSFIANGATDPGPLHIPGECFYYTLDPADIDLTLGPDPNG